MSVGYGSPEITLSPHESTARFHLQNNTGETWDPALGFQVGIHFLDRETEVLLEEGPRWIPKSPIAPGESQQVEIHFAPPADPGEYRIYFSPLTEGEAWFYERGLPFLLTDVTVDQAGNAQLDRKEVTTQGRLRKGRFLRSLGRAFTLPFHLIWQNRSLMQSMVRRDILGRYRGSFGGWFWTVLNPLMLMLTYFFVFGLVLNSKFPGDPSRTGFALNFLAGMLPWLAFSEATGRAPSNMLEYRTFIKKLKFPVETLPANLTLAGIVSEAFALLLFVAALLLLRGSVPSSVAWLPLLIIPQLLFTAGLCWFLAALGVFFRDLAQINGFLLTIWFFLTPICYSEAPVPPAARAILTKNPIYVLVRGYRSVFLEAHAPAWGPLWKLWLLSVIVFLLGHAWFYKLRKSFADVI